MFFYAAKLGWFVLQPSNALTITLVLGAALLFTGWRRIGRWLVALSVAGVLIGGFSPLANMLLQPLEDRFERPQAMPDDVAGIILLGGGLDTIITTERNLPALNEAGDRLTEFASLARRYPDARLVLSGGTGGLIFHDVDEAGVMRDLLVALGIDPERLELEDRSRDTYENAVFSRELVDPQPGERWLLVTSAFHIPRAVGCFRAAGFDVIAYPSDYRTRGASDWGRGFYAVSTGLRRLDVVTREWLGLVVYRLTGRTNALLPVP